jgi:membrane protein required for colicin V production
MTQGFIISLFSIIAFIVGMAAAMKLSSAVGNWLMKNHHESGKWIPFVSFLIVFIGVVLLIRIGAKFLEKFVELLMMGWLNKLTGILLFLILYCVIYSIFLFYATRLNVIQKETIEASLTYPYIHPWGQKTIDSMGMIIPFFKGSFTQLESFFQGYSNKIRY